MIGFNSDEVSIKNGFGGSWAADFEQDETFGACELYSNAFVLGG